MSGWRNQVRFQARERDFVHAIARKFINDEDDAADVAQDALLTAFRHRESFRGDSLFTTWLYQVTRTTALMHLRSKRRQLARGPITVVRDEDADEELVAKNPSPEDEIAGRQALSRVYERLHGLGEKYIEIFRMRFGDGCSEAEVARRLGVGESTVKNRTHRGRERIRERLRAA